LLDADADRADLELRLIKLLLKDRARAHPFAGNGGSWRKAGIPQSARQCYRPDYFRWAKPGEYVMQVTAIDPLALERLDRTDEPRQHQAIMGRFVVTLTEQRVAIVISASQGIGAGW
jgi:hypothetical protein